MGNTLAGVGLKGVAWAIVCQRSPSSVSPFLKTVVRGAVWLRRDTNSPQQKKFVRGGAGKVSGLEGVAVAIGQHRSLQSVVRKSMPADRSPWYYVVAAGWQ